MSSEQSLPVNFVDAKLKTGETLKKYNMIENDDGTVSFQDVTDYEVTGSAHTADLINHQNRIINELMSGGSGVNIKPISLENYEKLTDKSGWYLVSGLDDYNTGTVYYNNTIYDANYYDGDEKVVGRWVDGKPIYRKVYHASGLSLGSTSATTLVVDSSLTSSYVDVVIHTKCTHRRNNGQIYGNIPYMSTDHEFSYITTDGLKFQYALSVSSVKITEYTIVVEYTKSSDEANSFTPSMLTHKSKESDLVILPTVATDDDVEEVLE